MTTLGKTRTAIDIRTRIEHAERQRHRYRRRIFAVWWSWLMLTMRQRRGAAQLRALDERALHDLGLSRSNIEAAARGLYHQLEETRMPLVTQEIAMSFAQDWIEAWNRHDLDAVLDLFTRDFEFSSPYIIELANEVRGCLRGRETIQRYWETGLARIPDLQFRLIDVLAGVSSLTIYYSGHRGMVAETFHLDSNGKVFKAVACYSVSSTWSDGGHHE